MIVSAAPDVQNLLALRAVAHPRTAAAKAIAIVALAAKVGLFTSRANDKI